MKRYIYLITFLTIIVAGFFLLMTYKVALKQTSDIATPVSATPLVIASDSPSPMSSPSVRTTSLSTYYPMTRYNERLTNRWYGKAITAKDSEPLACGFPYEGFHTGDDLEISEQEKNTNVPVYAIADGTVRDVATTTGYGGLIVIEHQLEDRTVTAYYGHIARAKTSLRKSDTVTAGQQITMLGDDCSNGSGNERKHLHFSIRNGSAIDVKGYVQTESELSSWVNPKTMLEELKASEPK